MNLHKCVIFKILLNRCIIFIILYIIIVNTHNTHISIYPEGNINIMRLFVKKGGGCEFCEFVNFLKKRGLK